MKMYSIRLLLMLWFIPYSLFAEENKVDIDEQNHVNRAVDKLNSYIAKENSSVDDFVALHVYTPNELNAWIETGSQLSIIKEMYGCQFSEDIRNRAEKGMAVAYEFMYGDMLLSGTCVDKDVNLGIYYITKSSWQAYPAAMRRLAFYYEIGRYVVQDKKKAEVLMREAAVMGFLPAKIDWVAMLLRNIGSPKDYVQAYSMLHHSIFSTPVQKRTSERYLEMLAERMPQYAIDNAKYTYVNH